jgi:hypothetical protein
MANEEPMRRNTLYHMVESGVVRKNRMIPVGTAHHSLHAVEPFHQ